MKKAWVMIIGMLGAGRAETQVFHSPVKSAYQTGGAYSERFTDAFSFIANPAVLGVTDTAGLALSTERKWMLKELDCSQLAGSFPTGDGGIGFQFRYAGDPDYNESALAIAYGKNLGRISLGVQFGYEVYRASGYGSKTTASVMLGIRFHPEENFYAGLAIGNSLFAKKEKANPERGPGNFTMGFGYAASPAVLISLQFVKETGIPLNGVAGVDYRWSDQFLVALGIETNSASPYAKAGWRKNRLTVEIFTAWHAAMGFTPGLVLLLGGKKKPG
jgi:hypothetical protein